MKTSSSVEIRAPADRVFAMVSDLERWPERLPHYRSIEVLERRPDGWVVRMSASRDGIPVSWVSLYRAIPETRQLYFEHLRAWTKGMVVWWNLAEANGVTRVEITHDLAFRFRPLAPVVEPIISGFFIEAIAGKTLRTFKGHLEREEGA
jgi:aromatase